jgi:hypothetical protein
MSHTVRLTIWPDRELTISDAEYLDLDRRGMILHPQPEPEPMPEPVPIPEPTTPTPAPRPRRRSKPVDPD